MRWPDPRHMHRRECYPARPNAARSCQREWSPPVERIVRVTTAALCATTAAWSPWAHPSQMNDWYGVTATRPATWESPQTTQVVRGAASPRMLRRRCSYFILFPPAPYRAPNNGHPTRTLTAWERRASTLCVLARFLTTSPFLALCVVTLTIPGRRFQYSNATVVLQGACQLSRVYSLGGPWPEPHPSWTIHAGQFSSRDECSPDHATFGDLSMVARTLLHGLLRCPLKRATVPLYGGDDGVRRRMQASGVVA